MTTSRQNWRHISTGDFPERDRFPFFCEELFRRASALDIVTPEIASFSAQFDHARVGTVGLMMMTTSPAHYTRTSELVRDGTDTLVALFNLEGRLQLAQGPEPLDIAVGQCVLSDNTEIGDLLIETEARHWCVQIPRHELANLMPRADRFDGIRLDNDAGALRLLAGYLRELRDCDIDPDSFAGRTAGHHLVDLIALALGARGEEREFATRRGLRAARRAAVLRAIDSKLGDPTLNAAKLAVEFGITPRYVHILFEDTGLTMSEYVLGKRLEKAAELLCDPRNDGRRISDLAVEVGFSDLSHFNRSFRRRFGDTPSALRTSGVSFRPRSDR